MKTSKPLFARMSAVKAAQDVERPVTVLPAPVSRYFDAPEPDGVLLRWMAPEAGTIGNVLVHIEDFNAALVGLRLEVVTVSGQTTINAKTTEPKHTLEGPYAIGDGDRVVLAVTEMRPKPQSAPDTPAAASLGRIWISFLFTAAAHA